MFKSRIEILRKHLRTGAEGPRSLWIYAAFLALATGALVAATVATRPSLGGKVWEIALLAGIALLTERQPVRISESTEITVSVLPILFAAVVFGPLAAMLV